MSFVIVSGVGKTYRPSGGGTIVPVLSAVDAEIRESEFVCLMGASGSGKSTLLTIIGAMNRPSEGQILVDEIDVYELSEERRADFRLEYIGFVFQQHHLLPYLTTFENVMLPLATSRMNAREKRDRANAALSKVGLGDKGSRLPNQLSGGEQGRVAIARAIVNEPPLLLADEPTGTLDSRTGDEIISAFRQLNAEGQTILMVTHNPENAAQADRILHIKDGRLVDNVAVVPLFAH